MARLSGPDPAGVVAALQLAVDHDDGDARRLDGRQGRRRFLDEGAREDDAVDTLGEQVLDVRGELHDVAVRVGDEYLDVRVVRGLCLHGLRHADEVGAAEREVGHADRDGVVFLGRHAAHGAE